MCSQLKVKIRNANKRDYNALTEISKTDKFYLDYPDDGYIIWEGELMITKDFIQHNPVFVAEWKGEVVGYCALTKVEDDFSIGRIDIKEGYWLTHLFVKPKYIKNGIGRQLIEAANNCCKNDGGTYMNILTNSNAKGFYNHMGAKYYGESLSNVEGRTVAIYELDT